jgi:diguanylate cyclase (GGDEF)-like protein
MGWPFSSRKQAGTPAVPSRMPRWRAQQRLKLLGAVLVAGIAAADWQIIQMERAGAIADFRTATTNLANGLSAQTSRMLLKLDAALTAIRDQAARDLAQGQDMPGRQATAGLLNASLQRLSGVTALFILDAQGRLAARAGTPPGSAGQPGGDVFLQLRDDPRAQIAVGAPRQDPASGAWVCLLARRITDAGNGFAGAVIASLSLAELEDFYRWAMPRQRRLTLLRQDGVVLVRFPHNAGATGRQLPQGAPWHAAAAGGSYLAPDALDALPVLAVLRPVNGLPLLIEASVAQADVLAGWRRQKPLLIIGGVLACGGVVLLVWIFAAQIRLLAERNTELEQARRELDVAVSNVSQGICFFDGQQRLMVCNRRFADIYKLPAAATQPGTSFADVIDHWFSACAPIGISRVEYLMSRAALVRTGQPNQTVVELTDGRAIAIQQQPMPDGGWVATHEDITERRRAEAQIAFLAHHDVLTGLPNRSMLLQRIDLALATAGRGQGFAVLFLDLDRFKAVNDALGHATGDKLLQEVASRLQATIRENDTVARLGGDEFVVLQQGVQTPDGPASLAQRIIAAVGAPYRIGQNDIVIGVSVGIDIALDNRIAPDILLKNADMALYMAKAEGRGTFRFFEPDMDAKAQNRHALERDLRRALERAEFTLHYQAIVDSRTGRARGFEALLRWQHPHRGLVGPSDFIPVAEESGLIVPIGAWALREACRQAATWPDPIYVSVNLSPVQFHCADLVQTARDAMTAACLAPGRLDLEITESILLQNSERNLSIMHDLHASGIGIVMDDFGMGYASFDYLLQFPFQRIKIDRRFVQGVAASRESAAVVRAILGLCRDLGINAIAEGVEDSRQLAALLAEGCTDVQGYLFSRPKPAALLTDFLAGPGSYPTEPAHAASAVAT